MIGEMRDSHYTWRGAQQQFLPKAVSTETSPERAKCPNVLICSMDA